MMIIETDNFIFAGLLIGCGYEIGPSVLGFLAFLGGFYAIWKAFDHIDPAGV